jgi:hypothetical protein
VVWGVWGVWVAVLRCRPGQVTGTRRREQIKINRESVVNFDFAVYYQFDVPQRGFIYVKQDTMVNLISRMEAALEAPASMNDHVP